MLPDAETTGTSDDEILEHLNHAMLSEVVPQLLKFREEFFVVTERQIVSGTKTRYRINPRAIGNRLRDIFWTDGEQLRHRLHSLAREELPDLSLQTSDQPSAFYIEGNTVVLYPGIAGGNGYLEIAFFFRPGELVLSTNTRTITALTSNNQATLNSAVPASWSTGSRFDIHSANSGAEIKSWSASATTVSASTIIFTNPIDGTAFGTNPAEIGDYICLEGEAALPGIPREMHPTLAQAALCRILAALSDENVGVQVSKLNRMLDDAKYMVNDRIEGRPRIIANRHSLFLGGGGPWRGSRSANTFSGP
jgi:hypothetical protein